MAGKSMSKACKLMTAAGIMDILFAILCTVIFIVLEMFCGRDFVIIIELHFLLVIFLTSLIIFFCLGITALCLYHITVVNIINKKPLIITSFVLALITLMGMLVANISVVDGNSFMFGEGITVAAILIFAAYAPLVASMILKIIALCQNDPVVSKLQ